MHFVRKNACRAWLSASGRATSLRGLARLGSVWDDSHVHDLWTRNTMTTRRICCRGPCCGGRRPAQARLVCCSPRCCRCRCRGGGC